MIHGVLTGADRAAHCFSIDGRHGQLQCRLIWFTCASSKQATPSLALSEQRHYQGPRTCLVGSSVSMAVCAIAVSGHTVTGCPEDSNRCECALSSNSTLNSFSVRCTQPTFSVSHRPSTVLKAAVVPGRRCLLCEEPQPLTVTWFTRSLAAGGEVRLT